MSGDISAPVVMENVCQVGVDDDYDGYKASYQMHDDKEQNIPKRSVIKNEDEDYKM